MFFGINDLPTAEYVSNRLGEETIVVRSGGTEHREHRGKCSSKGDGSYSSSTNENDNWAQQGRKLLKPEEILALSDRIVITFTPGVPPIWTTRIRYFEERNLARRPGLLGAVQGDGECRERVVDIAADHGGVPRDGVFRELALTARRAATTGPRSTTISSFKR